MASYNQYELVNFLKKKRKYMNARQIAKETNGTLTTVNRKLKKMVGKGIERKVRNIKVGKANHKIPVRFYRYHR